MLQRFSSSSSKGKHSRIGKHHRDYSIDSVSETELGINVTSMSIIPHSNVFDPLSLLGAFQRCPFLSDGTPAPAAFAPRVDWKETAETHIFKVDLPSLKKEQVKVEVEDGRVLKISGERGGWEEEKGDKWHRVERNSGQFLRRFRLPENAKVDEVKASMEDGVLTITVPKEVKKPQVKAIEISGA